MFFVSLSHVGDDSGLWPLVAARLASVTVVGALALLGPGPARLRRPGARALTAAAGALDAVANVLYLLAVREGLLSVVSVLAALYPVSTVCWPGSCCTSASPPSSASASPSPSPPPSSWPSDPRQPVCNNVA